MNNSIFYLFPPEYDLVGGHQLLFCFFFLKLNMAHNLKYLVAVINVLMTHSNSHHHHHHHDHLKNKSNFFL